MNDKKKGTPKSTNPQAEITAEEFEELKRDMRSAKLIGLAVKYQQQLIAAGVVLLIGIVGISLWTEQVKTRRESAAAIYHQALDSTDAGARRSLLDSVVRDYSDTTYAALAMLQLAALDRENAEAHLRALLARSDLSPEISWQARLDLAREYIEQGKKAEVEALLAESVGRHYEQLRHYLMAEAATDASVRISHYEQALASESHDTELVKHIEQRLAALKQSAAPEKGTGE